MEKMMFIPTHLVASASMTLKEFLICICTLSHHYVLRPYEINSWNIFITGVFPPQSNSLFYISIKNIRNVCLMLTLATLVECLCHNFFCMKIKFITFFLEIILALNDYTKTVLQSYLQKVVCLI